MLEKVEVRETALIYSLLAHIFSCVGLLLKRKLTFHRGTLNIAFRVTLLQSSFYISFGKFKFIVSLFKFIIKYCENLDNRTNTHLPLSEGLFYSIYT
jgi:hypothetical protein